LETQRQWSDRAIARISPVLSELFSPVAVLAPRLNQGGQIPVPVTAWYHKLNQLLPTVWRWCIGISGVPGIS